MFKSILRRIIKVFRKKEIIPVVKTVFQKDLMKNKVVLITGGTGGIGYSAAKSFLENWGGVKIILSGTNIEKLNEFKTQLNRISPGNVETVSMNLKDCNSFDEKIKEISQIFGSIDVLIHSAGVHTENVGFWTMVPDEFERVISINLKAAYFMAQKIAEYFKENHIKGKMIFISSSRGSEPAWSPYGISKWGMNGMIKGLAKIFSEYGITVNAVAPGSTATSLIGYKNGESIYSDENFSKRLIMPEEVSNLILLLASDAGAMINGEIIHISAGRGVFDVR